MNEKQAIRAEIRHATPDANYFDVIMGGDFIVPGIKFDVHWMKNSARWYVYDVHGHPITTGSMLYRDLTNACQKV